MSGSSKSHFVPFPAISWKQWKFPFTAYFSSSHLWVVIGTWKEGVLGAKGKKSWNQDRDSRRCAVPSPLEAQWKWRVSHTSEVHWHTHTGMWLQGQAELEAGSVGAGANIVSGWCVYWQPAHSRMQGPEWASSKLWEKLIATPEPVGMNCCYNIAAEVVMIQMKHLRGSFTTHLAHEISMGKGQNMNRLTGQISVSSLLFVSPFGKVVVLDCKSTPRAL